MLRVKSSPFLRTTRGRIALYRSVRWLILFSTVAVFMALASSPLSALQLPRPQNILMAHADGISEVTPDSFESIRTIPWPEELAANDSDLDFFQSMAYGRGTIYCMFHDNSVTNKPTILKYDCSNAVWSTMDIELPPPGRRRVLNADTRDLFFHDRFLFVKQIDTASLQIDVQSGETSRIRARRFATTGSGQLFGSSFTDSFGFQFRELDCGTGQILSSSTLPLNPRAFQSLQTSPFVIELDGRITMVPIVPTEMFRFRKTDEGKMERESIGLPREYLNAWRTARKERSSQWHSPSGIQPINRNRYLLRMNQVVAVIERNLEMTTFEMIDPGFQPWYMWTVQP